jgi:hypothetical protein
MQKADLLKDPEQAAAAFDDFFSTLGDLGEDVCDQLGPEAAPAKPYFTFLKEMKTFFADWLHFMKAYTKRMEDMSEGKYVPPPVEDGSHAKAEPVKEKDVAFDGIDSDLKEKAEKYYAAQTDPIARGILADAVAKFMASYTPLLELWKQRQNVGVLGFRVTGSQKEEAEALLEKMKPLYQQALEGFPWMSRAIPVEADIAALKMYDR